MIRQGYFGPAPREPLQRFFDYIRFDGMGCWLWTGAKTRLGYGNFYITRRSRKGRRGFYAHRWLYERIIQSLPDCLELDHLCRVPACCNPDHLEPVTHAENLRRGVNVGRHKANQ